jgi:enamidase
MSDLSLTISRKLIGMTIIDGIVRTQRSRNTPPATRLPEIVGH